MRGNTASSESLWSQMRTLKLHWVGSLQPEAPAEPTALRVSWSDVLLTQDTACPGAVCSCFSPCCDRASQEGKESQAVGGEVSVEFQSMKNGWDPWCQVCLGILSLLETCDTWRPGQQFLVPEANHFPGQGGPHSVLHVQNVLNCVWIVFSLQTINMI